MSIKQHEYIDEISALIADPKRLVRAIFSGRRRNMSPKSKKTELRPVRLGDKLVIQKIEVTENGSKTSNHDFGNIDVAPLFESGFANFLVEATDVTLTIRFTKQGNLQVHREERKLAQDVRHDRAKNRFLNSESEVLRKVGITDHRGAIKPSMTDKFMQIEEFLRILMPTLLTEISSKNIPTPSLENPLRIVDHGCGNAYLTFAVHEHLDLHNLPNSVLGIDQRAESRDRNIKIAAELDKQDAFDFRAEKISSSTAEGVDIAMALHACDTATDEALAWSIKNGAKILLVSPCCHHQLQTQMSNTPEPWRLVMRHGILKERFADILTDSLRSHLLKLHGYRSEIIEFIGDEHTPRNLMIRAVWTGAKASSDDLASYREFVAMWAVRPYLAELLDFK